MVAAGGGGKPDNYSGIPGSSSCLFATKPAHMPGATRPSIAPVAGSRQRKDPSRARDVSHRPCPCRFSNGAEKACPSAAGLPRPPVTNKRISHAARTHARAEVQRVHCGGLARGRLVAARAHHRVTEPTATACGCVTASPPCRDSAAFAASPILCLCLVGVVWPARPRAAASDHPHVISHPWCWFAAEPDLTSLTCLSGSGRAGCPVAHDKSNTMC